MYPERNFMLMKAIKEWMLDPQGDFVRPCMIRNCQGQIISVDLKPEVDAKEPASSLTIFIEESHFYIKAQGVLKSAREEARHVVLLPLYQDGDVMIEGMRTGMYNGQLITIFKVSLYEDMQYVRRVLMTLMLALV